MASQIDITKPVYGNPTTQSVRDNFEYAYDEITDLQNKTTGAPFLPILGGTMNGPINMQNDPANPLEVATKRYVDNLAFGTTGGVPEAPVDGFAYAREHIAAGMTWTKTPQFQTILVTRDGVATDFHIGSDTTYNFIKFAEATEDYLRFNRTSKQFELVSNNVVVQSWLGSNINISGSLSISNNFTTNGSIRVASNSPTIHLDSATVADEYIYLETNGLKRWSIGADAAASGFGIFNYDASGNVIGKQLSIDKTTGAISLSGQVNLGSSLTPAGLIVDTRGNVGIGIVPPATTFLPAGGGFLFAGNLSVASNIAHNAYYDGTNWRYLTTASAWDIEFTATDCTWHFASSGTKDSIATFTTPAWLNSSGTLNIVAGLNCSGVNTGAGNVVTTNVTANATVTAHDVGASNSVSFSQALTPAFQAYSTATFEYIVYSGGWYWAWDRTTGDLNWCGNGNGTTFTQFKANGSLRVRPSTDNSIACMTDGGYLTINGATVLANGANIILNGGGRGTNMIEFYWGTGQKNYYDNAGNFFCNAAYGYQPGGGSWIALSGLAIKENINDYHAGLKEVLQLRPVSYNYNGKFGTIKDGTTFYGLIAEEVQNVMPEMVGKIGRKYKHDDWDEEETEIPTINSTALTYALINAVKELNARITILEGKL